MVEFGSLLEQYVTDSSSLLITGDFNFHVDNNLDKSSQDFLALIDSFNLKQHVCSPTHLAGHIPGGGGTVIYGLYGYVPL